MNPTLKSLIGTLAGGAAICAAFIGISAQGLSPNLLESSPNAQWLNQHRTSPGQKSAPLMATAASDQKFQCVLTYSDDWEDYEEPGVYTFEAKSPISFSSAFVSEDYRPSGGAFFTDKYYILTSMSEDWFTGEVSVTSYKYTRGDWEEVNYANQTMYCLYNAICYDPIDDRAYGYFYSDNGGAWGYMNIQNLGVTHLAEMDTKLVAVAISEQGKAYGITSEGDLCSIDKSNGALTVIGSTGLSPYYMQSAAFGTDGKLYWAASEYYSSGLYAVDLQTGAATAIASFPGTEEVCALYAIAAAPAGGAPAKAEGLKADVSGSALSFPFSFAIPAKTYGGTELAGDVNYAVSIDGENAATGSAAAGTEVSVNLTVTTPGYHMFKVVLSNAEGASEAASLRAWIGVDEPKPVKDALVEKVADKSIKIIWTAPDAGVNGGYFSPDLLTYSITRLPDNAVVAQGLKATEFTDNITLEQGQSLIRYLITPYAETLAGKATETPGIVIGDPYQTPVEFTFDTDEDYNIFTVIDNNETVNFDSGLWQYTPSGQAAGYTGGTKDGDDWLITPSVALKARTQYTISHDVLCYSDTWPEEYSVYIGTSPTIEGMTTEIVPPTTIWWDEYRTKDVTVTVPADGVYYLGFHATSEAGSVFFLIDNISIRESYKLDAPAEVTGLSVTAGDKGARTASISFTTPFNSVEGQELDDDVTVKICRNGLVIKTYYDVAPDEQMSYVDTDPVDREMNTYEVFCSNYYGAGPAVSSDVWVGLDSPSAPQSAKVVLDADGHPVISWDKPEGRGVHGGYVDNDDLEYTVAYVKNGALTPVAEKTSAFSCTDTETVLENTGVQAMHQFYIMPSSKATGEYGENAAALYISGQPYGLPFRESFAGRKATNFWAFTGTNGEGWEIGDDFSIGSQDNDDGVLSYLPAMPEVTTTAMSGKINISAAANPQLNFYLRKMSIADNGFYDTDPSKDVLYIKAGVDGFELQTIETIRLADIKKAGEYIFYSLSLKELDATEFVVVAFEYHAVSDRTPIMIDNITVKDMCDYNVMVGEISYPEAVEVMETLTVNAAVNNAGSNPMENIAVRLLRDGYVEAQATVASLDPDKTANVELEAVALPGWGEHPKFTVEVVAAKDEIKGDDASEEFSVTLIFHERPAVTDLTYTLTDSELQLAWTAPEGIEQVETRVTETFESYGHGDLSFGNWISEDKSFWGFEGIKTVTVDGVTLDIPNSDDSQAFMVFDPAMAGIDFNESPEWEPVSGDKLIVSFGDAANEYLEPNNDWLVSPELSGKKQTISFWARTAAKKGKPDEIRVYATSAIEYNNNGTVKTSCFSPLDDSDITLAREWTKYEFELPAGTQRFAIRNLSDDGFAVLIDDITYEPAVEKVNANFEGYNVYRDGSLVNASPITETTYNISPIEYGSYTVRAVYDEGESADSNTVKVEGSVIGTVVTPITGIYYDLKGYPVAEPTPGKIYILNGQKVIFNAD